MKKIYVHMENNTTRPKVKYGESKLVTKMLIYIREPKVWVSLKSAGAWVTVDNISDSS